MTRDLRTYTYFPTDDASVAGFHGWLAWVKSEGYTVQDGRADRPSVTIAMRKPDLPISWAALPVGAEGVDVSEHQGTIEWDKVKAGGIQFAYIRVSSVYAEDERFLVNWTQATIARGAYHYWRHDADNSLQIDRISRSLLGEGELPLAVDVELRDGEADPPASERPAITEKLHNFLLGLEARLGYRPVIYTSARYWHAMTTRPAWATDYGLWLADWGGALDYPEPWSWAFLHQYGVTAERSVPGIVSRIDRNRWKGWEAPVAPVLFRVRIITAVLNIRSGPGTANADIGDAMRDEVYSVYEEAAGWYRVHPTEQRWISGNAAYSVRA